MEDKDIIEIVADNFNTIDDIPRDYDKELEIIKNHKILLMLESILASNYFDTFISQGKIKINDKGGVTANLEQPITIERSIYDQKISIKFDRFIIYTGNKEADNNNLQYKNNFLHLDINKYLCHHLYINEKKVMNSCTYQNITLNKCIDCTIFRTPIYNKHNAEFCNPACYPHTETPNFPNSLSNNNITIKEMIHAAITKFDEICLWDLIKPLTQFNTYEKLCKFTANKQDVLSPVVQKTKIYKDEPFYNFESKDNSEIKKISDKYSHCAEESIIEHILEQNIFHATSVNINKSFRKTYSNGYQPIMNLPEDGLVDYIITKTFYPENQTKLLIPITHWSKNKAQKYKNFCIPTKDIVNNLVIKNVIDSKSLILMDSYDLFSLNWDRLGREVSLASYWNKDYKQIDFQKIKNYDNVFLLVNNNSGKSLIDAYENAKAIGDYLRKKYEVKLQYIQIAVDYREEFKLSFKNVRCVEKYYTDNTPKIIKDSIIIMNQEKFNKNYEKACQSLIPFWQKTDIKLEAEEDGEDESLDFLLRPCIARRKMTIIHAPSETGKTSFVFALSSAIVANQKPIAGKCWNTFPPSSSKYKYNKVVHLDFESGKDIIKGQKENIAKQYFSKDTVEYKKCMKNLIIRDLKEKLTNYSEEANQQKLLDKVLSARNEGEKGQPVDMCVIDTYGNLVKAEHNHTWHNIEPFIKKLLNKNMAVVIIAHSNEQGELEGFKKKRHSCEAEIKLFRKDANITTLEDPTLVECGKNRLAPVKIEKLPFLIHLNKKFKIYNPDKIDSKSNGMTKIQLKEAENIEYALTAKAYKKKDNYQIPRIAKLLGHSKSQFSEICKKVKLSLPKENDYCKNALKVREKYMDKK